MNLTEAVNILRIHNEWNGFNEFPDAFHQPLDQPPSIESVHRAIDCVVDKAPALIKLAKACGHDSY